MPAIVVASLIGAAATTSTALIATHAQGKAADKAAAVGTAANDAALAFQREQEATRKSEFDSAEAENKRQYDLAASRDRTQQLIDLNMQNRSEQATQRAEGRQVDEYNNEQTRRQPYRDTSMAAVQKLAARAGLVVTPSRAPQLSAPPPVAPPLTMADLLRMDRQSQEA